ncbi:hypothetical protein [Pelomonas sp. KK5]|uniref:hypothetical protein n=1 Tax=Pelomonas sp. KK5 TaxID=1855730 RepID=UPI00097C6462|nr:hypothetical protein [Pelomonas sp. KK5]
MRTTLDLPDELLRHLKARAALEGRSLRDLTLQLIERGLQVSLAPPAPAAELPTLAFGRNIPAKYLSNAGLFELLDEEE